MGVGKVEFIDGLNQGISLANIRLSDQSTTVDRDWICVGELLEY